MQFDNFATFNWSLFGRSGHFSRCGTASFCGKEKFLVSQGETSNLLPMTIRLGRWRGLHSSTVCWNLLLSSSQSSGTTEGKRSQWGQCCGQLWIPATPVLIHREAVQWAYARRSNEGRVWHRRTNEDCEKVNWSVPRTDMFLCLPQKAMSNLYSLAIANC